MKQQMLIVQVPSVHNHGIKWWPYVRSLNPYQMSQGFLSSWPNESDNVGREQKNHLNVLAMLSPIFDLCSLAVHVHVHVCFVYWIIIFPLINRVVSRFLSSRFHPTSKQLFPFYFCNITLRTDLLTFVETGTWFELAGEMHRLTAYFDNPEFNKAKNIYLIKKFALVIKVIHSRIPFTYLKYL